MVLHDRRSGGIISFVLLMLLILPGAGLRGQSREQMRSQAETQLRQMSPDEIEKALKERGITVEEASKRAQQIGLSLDDYLQRDTGATQTRDQMLTVDPRLSRLNPAERLLNRDSVLIAGAPKVRRITVDVPGFRGRRGIDTLIQPFGFDLFQYPPSTFIPSVNVATPPSYVLGAGDELLISVWGETQLSYKLTVNREGNVFVPDIGPVLASGSSIQSFRDRLLKRMGSVYSGLADRKGRGGAYLDVSLGKLKTIQVYVLGEVARPGGFALTSMSVALHALYAAGGPTVNGTLRTVEVLRQGEPVRQVDLYSYILRGDTRTDVQLQDNDIVFVRPAGKRAAIVGRVVRPAIYELLPAEKLGDLIALGGGLRFDAHAGAVHVERIVPFDQREKYTRDLLDVDLAFASAKQMETSAADLENGDIVTIRRIPARYSNRVTIDGNVEHAGPYELRAGMRVADLVRAADSLKPSTFLERGTLFRLRTDLRREVIGFNLRLALAGDSLENPLLRNEDSVVVYPDSQFNPVHGVSVYGAVQNPGLYPRLEGMSVSDLVVMAGGLKDHASKNGWELSRLDTTELDIYTRTETLDMPKDYWHTHPGGRLEMKDYDVLFVPFDPRVSESKFVKVTGYVMFPGVYAIRHEGERLSEIFARVGGLRRGAYLEGSRLIRKFNNAGLVPLSFRDALEEPESRDNVVVYDGDSINVAFLEDVVYVSGEVYVPSPVLYSESAGLGYYIDQAGGYREEAEKGNTVVFLPGGKKWEGGDILPGSSIYVPRKIEKPDTALPIIRDLATILASLAAITVALVQVTR